MTDPDVLLHPVRMRIVLALGGRELTTAQLADAMPDVARTSLYRHAGVLLEAGAIRVVAEREVRGAVERTFALVSDEVTASGDLDSAALKSGIAAFTASVGAAFAHAVDGGVTAQDPVSFRQVALDLTDEQALAMAGEIAAVVERYEEQAREEQAEAAPGGDTRRFLLSAVLHPDASRPEPQA
ncbi:helix-turn-helix domain-containing protein [uncultured Demequina sp.]|uniref:helix-turn-helix domain-containing protein n=1 Tax=uncultured Demequina sp. TaxID=693499 RepID=UPI0025FD0FCA|nr:helix-turn-helix domain-containing protein [uncultured Demequina sp.]